MLLEIVSDQRFGPRNLEDARRYCRLCAGGGKDEAKKAADAERPKLTDEQRKSVARLKAQLVQRPQ